MLKSAFLLNRACAASFRAGTSRSMAAQAAAGAPSVASFNQKISDFVNSRNGAVPIASEPCELEGGIVYGLVVLALALRFARLISPPRRVSSLHVVLN